MKIKFVIDKFDILVESCVKKNLRLKLRSPGLKSLVILVSPFFSQSREKQARTKSAELLRKELDNEQNKGSIEYLNKVSKSMCLLVL